MWVQVVLGEWLEGYDIHENRWRNLLDHGWRSITFLAFH